MKATSKFTIIILFAIAVAACQNDSNDDRKIDSNEFVVANGMIQSPQWLAHVVDTVARRYNPSPETGNYPYPWVYSVKYNNQDYFYVLDGLNSCSTCGTLFFTLSGEPIEGFPGKPGENLYRELSAAIEDRTLLWRHGE